MPGSLRVASLAILFATNLAGAASAQTDSFESLIDSILKRHGVVLPPEEPAQPAPDAPIENAPTQLVPQPAPQPQLVPVEPGPRPYTPPKIDRPPEEKPPSQTTSTTPASSTETTVPAVTAPDASAPQADAAATPVVPGQKRTLETLTAEEVNTATFAQSTIGNPEAGASPFVLKLQVMLDRVGASPGVIDSYYGGNVLKAVAAVETVIGDAGQGELTESVWDALGGDAAPPALMRYTITPEDVAYPFVASIPPDYVEQSRLPGLGYQSPEEMFGERFHMDTKLLRALNPNADFRQAGSEIWVTDIGKPIAAKVARIVADKAAGQVRAYDAGNHLIVAYAATIGSEANPTPFGDHKVSEVLHDPLYGFASGGLGGGTLPPGPNNPLGTIWIGLTDPGYGIQGTPEPAKIGKTAPDGAVRLTNWDAEELAGLVEPGIVVSFTP